ncbi:MAG: Fur family transcriptional regulator [Elusimicrobiota bacterium]|nr:Fur family transcriptional regulator [Elusimicrobiota bacterium]
MGYTLGLKRSCLTSEEIERRLADAGVHATAQRIAIARYVLCEADHPTADQVKSWADKNFPKMSMATVYNTLKILVAAGLLKKIAFPHLNEAVYDDNITAHYHLIDEKTGRMSDLDPADFKVTANLKGVRIKEIEIFIKGRRELS